MIQKRKLILAIGINHQIIKEDIIKRTVLTTLATLVKALNKPIQKSDLMKIANPAR